MHQPCRSVRRHDLAHLRDLKQEKVKELRNQRHWIEGLCANTVAWQFPRSIYNGAEHVKLCLNFHNNNNKNESEPLRRAAIVV